MEKTYIFTDAYGYWSGLYSEAEKNNSVNRNQAGWSESAATDEEIIAHNRAVAKRISEEQE